ncbi:MAG: phosphatidate cytidylyltransferase [Hyphomicrobiaceae bacterium]|nr:phosphatidate cytidylyltransferase [Hyphomicrobiaceae bacterium]
MSAKETELPQSSTAGNAAPSPKRSDLKPRLLAGVAMALVAVGITYSGAVPFAAMVGIVALVMCWEWGRMVRGDELGIAFPLHLIAVAAATALAAAGMMREALFAVGVGAIVVLALAGRHRLMSAAGVIYVGLPVVALIWFRNDSRLGLEAVLFLFLVIWTSDIAAFASGRTFGGPKLWPRVSPNKTWSGFIGGITASALVGAMVAQFVAGASSAELGATGLVLALIAQMGDLAESALKRSFGVKDSSAIIPGHGGVMDRADSTVAVSVAAAIFALLWNAASPAAALLIGG